MLPALEEIPRLRKTLDLTQAELARRSGVSQSTVAKVERHRMSPSYDVVRRLLTALYSEAEKREKRAVVGQVATRKVQYVDAKLSVEEAVREMRRHQFSQLPVFHQGHSVGSISDQTITDLILSAKDPRELARTRIEDVMEPPFPQIDGKAPVELAATLLRHYSAVLVATKGSVFGIVTKSDLMKLL